MLETQDRTVEPASDQGEVQVTPSGGGLTKKQKAEQFRLEHAGTSPDKKWHHGEGSAETRDRNRITKPNRRSPKF